MLRKTFIIIISLFLFRMPILAHASWKQHADDMYEVFGFERTEELTNWMKFVSSVLIDNNNSDRAFSKDGISFNFHSYLQEKYPDFRCKHRLLFHWGYNSRPWSNYLQDKVNHYGWSEDMINDFQADLVAEQKRRNGFANEYTENVFGFAHGGKEARIARVLISIAYDVHILGDYEPDNTDLEGLQDMGSVVGDIINNLTALDKKNSSALSKQLKRVSQGQEYELQDKATILLDLLKENFSNLLRNANEGEIAAHLASKGFLFTDCQSNQTRVEEQKLITKHQQSKNKDFPIQSRDNGVFVVIIICSLAVLGLLLVLLFKKHK